MNEPSTVCGLGEHYTRLGVPSAAWLVGPEHPALEDLGIRLLSATASARILELGVQSGGFAVPVILAAAHRDGFAYTGVDNLAYTNAVPLRHIAGYLALHGITGGVRFVEGDSGAVVRAAAPRSYDLILIDHFKPRYPIDLYGICSRDLLSDDGRIVLHDVLGNAAGVWTVCERVCRAFGYDWTIDANVPEGAAVVRRAGRPRSTLDSRLAGLEVVVRWQTGAAIRGVRRAIGRTLRRAGLRRQAER